MPAPTTAGPPPYPPAQGGSLGYRQWAPNQHPNGNVYDGSQSAPAWRGYDPAPTQRGYDPPENTDSLTGHILAQGRPDTDGPRNTMRVVMIMLIMLAAVVVGTVIAIS